MKNKVPFQFLRCVSVSDGQLYDLNVHINY